MEHLRAIRHSKDGCIQVESATFTATFRCSERGLRLCEHLVSALMASKSEISCWAKYAVHTHSLDTLPSFQRPSWKKALRLARRRCPSPRKDAHWVQSLTSTPLPFMARLHAAENTDRVLHFLSMCLPATCQRQCACPSPQQQLQRILKCRTERHPQMDALQRSQVVRQALAKCGGWDRWAGPSSPAGAALRAHQQRWRFRSVLSLFSPHEMQLWAALVDSVSFLLEFQSEFRWCGDHHSLYRAKFLPFHRHQSVPRAALFLVVYELHRWIPVRSALAGTVDLRTGKRTRWARTAPLPLCCLCVDLGQDNVCSLDLSFLRDARGDLFLDVSTSRMP